MQEIAALFSSKARWDVLRVLVHQTAPLPLRHVAALSDSSLFSVQRALRQLVKGKILIRRKKGPHLLFSLNEAHPLRPFLDRFFDLETEWRLTSLAGSYQGRAQGSLDFSSAARDLFRHARS